jgi:hypothetical protein
MKYFITPDAQVYAYEDNQMDWVRENNKIAELKLTAISEAEANALINPPPSKEELLQQALSLLDNEKEERLKKLKVNYNGANYDADERSQLRVTGAVTLLALAPEGITQSWIDADNQTRELTAHDLAAIGAAIANAITAITLEYRAKKDEAIGGLPPPEAPEGSEASRSDAATAQVESEADQ